MKRHRLLYVKEFNIETFNPACLVVDDEVSNEITEIPNEYISQLILFKRILLPLEYDRFLTIIGSSVLLILFIISFFSYLL